MGPDKLASEKPAGLELYSTKKVKEISENHLTEEHQSKQLFNFHLFV